MSLALYRKYRPGTFAEVIGQEHVTEPICAGAALRPDPPRLPVQRSARLRQDLERAHPGPLAELREGPDPDAVRRVRLAAWRSRRTGPGSLDVIEIDAASHGLVDDARDLRERAFFAPVSSRFKIYVIDEAHMITTAAFNALLKVVEEPPPHVKFIFATTEPDKVLADDQVADLPLPVPADPAADHARAPGRALRERGHRGRAGGAAADRARGRRLGARRAVDPRPARRRVGRRAASPTTGRSPLLGYTDARAARRGRRRLRGRRRRGRLPVRSTG